MQNLTVTWQEFDVLGVYNLNVLFSMIPIPAVKTKHDFFVVDQMIESLTSNYATQWDFFVG
jgi:hypothetical protein